MITNNTHENESGNSTWSGCSYKTPSNLVTVFYLTTVVGGSIALLSIAQNIVLLKVFSARRHFRRSIFLYFVALAVADLILTVSYILLFCVSYLYEWIDSEWLMNRWYDYVLLVTVFSHIVLCVSPYLLVAASIERYLASYHRITYTTTHRMLAIFGVIVFSIATKATVYWEVQVAINTDCVGMGSKYIAHTDLAADKAFAEIWVFWYRNIVTVFAPFFLLLVLNLLLLRDYGAKRSHFSLPQFSRRPILPPKLQAGPNEEVHYGVGNESSYLKPESIGTFVERARNARIEKILQKACIWARRARARVRKATTRTLIAIIAEYLICHSLSFVVTTWEHIDQQGMYGGDYRNFFIYGSEIINLMTVISCCIRLPTYLICDVTFRREVYWIIGGGFTDCARSSFGSLCRILKRKHETGSVLKKKGIQKGINETTSMKYAPKNPQYSPALGYVVLELLETKSYPGSPFSMTGPQKLS